MNERAFSTGEAGAASDLSAKTIRYYEGIGLIPPVRRGNRAARTGGNRVYSGAEVDRLRFIRGARLLGLGLDDVRDLLAAADGGCPGEQPLYCEKLADHLQAIDDRIENLLAMRTAVQHLLSQREDGRKACTSAGCGCTNAPELSSKIAAPLIEPMSGIALNGGSKIKGVT